MKYSYLLLCLWLCLHSCRTSITSTQQAVNDFQNKRVLFLGNSITQNGSYVSFIQYFLEKEHPDWNLDIISVGLGSETVSCLTEPDHPFPRPCLEERLDRVLDEIKPDIVISCYGMNDGIYHPPSEEIMAAYQKGIEHLRQKVQDASAKLILATPPPFDPLPIKERLVDGMAPEFGYKTPYEGYDDVLGEFSEWLLSLESEEMPVVDWHGGMNERIKEIRATESKATFAQDGVHPSMDGHLLMAKIFLQKLGVPISDSLDWNTISKDIHFKRVHDQRQMRSNSWLKFVGYTRGETVKTISPRPLLIIMGGQSNMVGSGKRADLDAGQVNTRFPTITYFDFDMGTGLKENQNNFGPEIGISQVLSESFPNQPIILLKYARGGASLLDWAPDYSAEKAKVTGNPQFGNMYAKCLQRVDSIMQLYNPKPVAVLWMQGERDARIPEAGKEYDQNLQNLISAFRADLEKEDLPFIMGVVNPPVERYAAVDIVQKMQREIAGKSPTVYALETDDLEKWDDNLHYNSQGQLDLGKAFGEELAKLIK